MKSMLRKFLYRTEKGFQRLRFNTTQAPNLGWPILLGISFPKSGTHLLDQILLGFSKFAPFSLRLHSFYAEYDGVTGRKHEPVEAIRWLESLRPGDVTSAHIFAREEVLKRVCTSAFIPSFIYRDPRDVAVSHVFYVTEMEPNHVHHNYYNSLPDFDSRLKVSILGRPGEAVEFPDLARRFEPYLGWLDQPGVLKIHFEDLVHDRRRTLERILEHFLKRVPLNIPTSRLLDGLEQAINPSRSPTFRSGKTGEWRNYFSEEHKSLFKKTAGDLLIRLGYEVSQTW